MSWEKKKKVGGKVKIKIGQSKEAKVSHYLRMVVEEKVTRREIEGRCRDIERTSILVAPMSFMARASSSLSSLSTLYTPSSPE